MADDAGVSAEAAAEDAPEADADFYWSDAKFWLWALSIYVTLAPTCGLFYRALRRRYFHVPTWDVERTPRRRPTEASAPLRCNGAESSLSLAPEAGHRPRTSSEIEEYVEDDEHHAAALRRWQERSHKVKVTKIAGNLEFVTIGLITYRTFRNLLAGQLTCMGYSSDGVFKWPPPRVETMEYIFLFLLLSQTDRCRRLPSTALYWGLLFVFNLYIPSSILWPLQWSCRHLEMKECKGAEHWYIKEAISYCDCSLTGVSATLMMMTWILVQPWALLRREMVHLVWVWLIGIYLGWSVLARQIMGVRLFTTQDMVGRVVILSCAIAASHVRKEFKEVDEKADFIYDLRKRKASEKIFHVFEYMVPEHVVIRMLQGECIADKYEQVTIMFVVIAEFDHRAEKAAPDELLRFLNEVFTYMDQACEGNKVTKVETVGEEYVACVGVTKDDVEDSKQHGHSRILGKMFRAGEEILQLHWEAKDEEEPVPVHPLHKKWGEVKLKIGFHTGPIVAGVIGRKLPRYRLFGDTINTAARMMQKGLVGSLQFGEPTYKELPPFVEAHLRGEVEMKGKGMVKAYLFDRLTFDPDEEQRRAASARTQSDSSRRKAKNKKRRSLTETIMETPVDDGMEESSGSRARTCSCAHDGRRSRAQTSHRSEVNGGLELVPVRRDADVYDIRHKNPELFEDVLRKFTNKRSRPPTSGLLAKTLNDLGFRVRFESSIEQKWSAWYHECTFTQQFARRIVRQFQYFVVITVFDFCCALASFVWPRQYLSNFDSSNIASRVAIYFLCRIICLVTVAQWHRLWQTNQDWFKSKPWKIQLGMLMTTCLQLVLFLFSYAALTCYDTEGSALWEEHRELKHKKNMQKAQPDQIFAMSFSLTYTVTSQWHHLWFWPSTVYVLLAIGMMVVLGQWPYGTMYFSFSGKLLFVINSCLNSLFAHDEEKSGRERFEKKEAAEQIHEDIRRILDKLMPKLVVTEMARPNYTPSLCSHRYEQATVAQSDLCGFTQLSATREPHEVVEFISDLFGMFDKLTDKYGIYKVETIGDAYIAGQAERPLTEENIPVHVLLFGLDMVDEVHKWSERLAGNHEPVSCRVGIHTGECIGGIVGTDMQRYHLFGKLMTCVEVLESTAKPAMVQLSPACRAAVERSTKSTMVDCERDLEFVERPEAELITSKGERHDFDEVGGRTYLVSRKGAVRMPP